MIRDFQTDFPTNQEEPSGLFQHPKKIGGSNLVCIIRTKQGASNSDPYTSFERVSSRKLTRMRVMGSSRAQAEALESDSSLAARELNFLVRLAQAAASATGG